MKNSNKKIAFTLAEVLIALGISAIIAILTFKAAQSGSNHYKHNLLTYSAFMSLTTAAYDMATDTQKGCTLADMAASGGLHPYCPGATGSANTGYIPWYITTSADATTRGFCDRVVNEEFNITGSSSCSSTASSNFNSATPAFTTTNGMRFFFDPSTNPSAKSTTGYYTMYVDIDGLNNNSSFGGVLNQDVLKFFVALDSSAMNADPNGPALLDPNGIAANSTDYLTASIKYYDGTKDVYVLSGAPYREAACLANTTAGVGPRALIANYCDGGAAQPNYPTAYNSQALVAAVAANCVPSGSQACVMVWDKPVMMGNN